MIRRNTDLVASGRLTAQNKAFRRQLEDCFNQVQQN